MRVLIQRVKEAKVIINDKEVSAINKGMLLLVAIGADDTPEDATYLTNKIISLRIFDGADKKINLNIKQIKGEILSVPQFTLYADTADGNKPCFDKAAKPAIAEGMWNKFNAQLHNNGIEVKEGRFGASMQVQLVNDGPVTIWLDSKSKK